ncbi:oligosaccharide flippase family protein [Peribacillus simplex]|uniref:putative polysaccharide biosynthesis protein n=1 Tax=Peribacillus simplex TaxID=1478 RepID=UPI0036732474
MKSQLLRSTALLSSASLISKVIGFIYIIPFTALVGTTGYALYKYAYGPYAIMISLSTMGIPLAVSKMVAKYDSADNEVLIKKIFKSGFFLMFASGVFFFLLLYLSAPLLANIVIDENNGLGNKQEDVIFVIKMVSFALLIIPIMSFFRGFLQGFNIMGPSASSTVMEQIVRILFILIGTFISINLFDSSITNAVGIATFGAFMGGLAGLLILIVYLYKNKKVYFETLYHPTKFNSLSTKSIYKDIIANSIPFVLISLSIPIYQNIDTFTINSILLSIDYNQLEAETVNSVVGLAQILVLIPVSITTGLSMSLIPSVAKSYNEDNMVILRSTLNQSFLVLAIIILPCSLGVLILSDSLYLLCFGVNNSPVLGGLILKFFAPAAIFIALQGVTSSILQSLNQHKKAIRNLLIGILIKVVLNFILPVYINEFGFIYATIAGFLVSSILNINTIHRIVNLKISLIIYKLLSIVLSSCVMIFIVYLTDNFLNSIKIFNSSMYLDQISKVFISIISGIIIFLITMVILNFSKYKKYSKSHG